MWRGFHTSDRAVESSHSDGRARKVRAGIRPKRSLRTPQAQNTPTLSRTLSRTWSKGRRFHCFLDEVRDKVRDKVHKINRIGFPYTL